MKGGHRRRNLLALTLVLVAAAVLARTQSSGSAEVPLFPHPLSPLEVAICADRLRQLDFRPRLNLALDSIVLPAENREVALAAVAAAGMPLEPLQSLDLPSRSESERLSKKLQTVLDILYPGKGIVAVRVNAEPLSAQPSGPRQPPTARFEVPGRSGDTYRHQPTVKLRVRNLHAWVILDGPRLKQAEQAVLCHQLSATIGLDIARGDSLNLRFVSWRRDLGD